MEKLFTKISKTCTTPKKRVKAIIEQYRAGMHAHFYKFGRVELLRMVVLKKVKKKASKARLTKMKDDKEIKVPFRPARNDVKARVNWQIRIKTDPANRSNR